MFELRRCQFLHDETLREAYELRNDSKLTSAERAEKVIQLLEYGNADEEIVQSRKKALRYWPSQPTNAALEEAGERVKQAKLKALHFQRNENML